MHIRDCVSTLILLRLAQVHESGFINLVERGDAHAADRGFTCDLAFAAMGAALVYPPFSEDNKAQFAADAAAEGYNQAQMRIHVERAIKFLKDWRYLDRVTPWCHIPFISNIIRAIVVLTNFTNAPIGPTELEDFDRSRL